MRLIDAARYFDRVPFSDAYNPLVRFRGQFDLFDDSKRDGGTVARRVVSVAGNVVMPPRGAVTAHGDVFVIGGAHKDSEYGTVIRQKFVCHKADGLAKIQTLDEALRGLPALYAYGARLWIKDMKEIEVSSRLSAFFSIFFSATENIAIGSVVTIAGRLHLVRNSYISAAGFRLCEADELPETALAVVTYTDKSGQAYDAASDTMGGLAPAVVPAIWHRFQTNFEYLRPSAAAFEPGDITAHVSKVSVATAGAGDTFTLLGDTFRVLDVRDSGANSWILHARRV